MLHAPAAVRSVLFRPLPLRLSVVLATIGCLVFLVGSAAGGPRAQQQQPTPQRLSAEEEFKAVRQKAEQGDATAQFMLGRAYGTERLVPRDPVQAFVWYLKAAEQGHVEAQRTLGFMYMLGSGVAQDHGQAVSWFRNAAEQGDAEAQVNLAFMYETGKGVPVDHVEARKWGNIAAALQEGLIPFRDSLCQTMLPAEFAEAEKRANEWLAAFEQRKK